MDTNRLKLITTASILITILIANYMWVDAYREANKNKRYTVIQSQADVLDTQTGDISVIRGGLYKFGEVAFEREK